MADSEQELATGIVGELVAGDRCRAADLAGLVYENLHRYAAALMRQEQGPRTLEPAALVHEAYMRMVNQSRVDWQGRTHFFAVGAEMIRRVLVDDARRRGAQKRGGGGAGFRRVGLTAIEGMEDGASAVDLLALDDALNELSRLDPRAARIVELKFFGGMREGDVAEVLGVSASTVRDDWRMARAWLREALREGAAEDGRKRAREEGEARDAER